MNRDEVSRERSDERDVEAVRIHQAARAKKSWRDGLTERALKELGFAQVYSTQYNHGTSGHHRLNLIHLMAELLDEAERRGRV